MQSLDTALYTIALIAVIVICCTYVWAIVTYHEETLKEEEELHKP